MDKEPQKSQKPNLEREIERAWGPERFRLRREWRNLAKQSNIDPARIEALRARVLESIERRERREKFVPKVRWDESLPITATRAEIRETIAQHQVVVICGETGSGKSTQLPKICLDMGRGIDRLIGHTQPRRIAARSIAARVASELGTELGREVGFQIRFTDVTSPTTYIKLMTDGILLSESQRDRFLDRYDTIILDEAHERSLNVDFLLGMLKSLLPRRPELRVIITSATLDAERFADFFATTAGPAPVLIVSGRSYPVEVRYRPPEMVEDEADWPSAMYSAFEELILEGPGDILAFLPTERDIHEMEKTLRSRPPLGESLLICPLYSQLPASEQNLVFETQNKRRIVLATNVAESSVTVPGIRSVVDSGLVRISRYSARSKMQRLPIEPISQASAEQRKGRCGRLGPGICIRLFSEKDFAGRELYTPPEIQRTNLASVILQLKAFGLGEIESFPFLDGPKLETIRDGYKTLFELGALDEKHELTPIGKKLAQLPVDPRVARMILAGDEEHVLAEILILASILELQDPRERPLDRQKAADEAHSKFNNEDSDFLALLSIWDFYQGLRIKLSRRKLRDACRQNFLSATRMEEWVDIHTQLSEQIERWGIKPAQRKKDPDALHRALLTGLLSNVAFKSDAGDYLLATGAKAFIWPGSGLLQKKPKWLVAGEMVETTKRYLRTIGRIQPAWVERLAAHLVTRSYSEPHWDRDSAGVMAFEKVTLGNLILSPRKRVGYGPKDPKTSRELFIQHALVEREWDYEAAFFVHNNTLWDEVDELQTRSRRKNLLRSQDAVFEFYDQRIPDDVFDGRRFDQWRKEAEATNPKLLFITRQEILNEEAIPVSPAEFPEQIAVRHLQLPVEYRFEPGARDDGVTLVIPREGLAQIDPGRLGWLVPGLLEERIAALIKTLPKHLRRSLVPVAETATDVFLELKFGEGVFLSRLAEALSKRSELPIRVEDFDPERLPDYLKMSVKVIDHQGQELAAGRDIAEVRKKLGVETPSDRVVDSGWSRDGLTSWSFGDLPIAIPLKRGDVTIQGYPALLDTGTACNLRLLESQEQASLQMRGGLRRLFVLAARREIKSQIDWLPPMQKWLMWGATLPDYGNLRSQLTDLLADRVYLADRPEPRTSKEFQTRLATARENLGEGVNDLLNVVGPLLETYQDARVANEKIAGTPNRLHAHTDIKQQLKELVLPGFLLNVPWLWLKQYPRYFVAIRARIRKLDSGNQGRDLQLTEQLRPFWERYVHRLTEQNAQGIYDPQLHVYRFLLEELRVSWFAQELGTPLPISEKRLEKQWALVRTH